MLKGQHSDYARPRASPVFSLLKRKGEKGKKGKEKGKGKGKRKGGIWVRESVWGTRGRKERSACKDAIVFSVLYAQILSVKIVTGQN